MYLWSNHQLQVKLYINDELTALYIMITLFKPHPKGEFRGGMRGVRPPKIRKAYVIQR
jgi:hypothetical protein